MRPNNQNKNRQRGRNGGRKHVNPLSRNYESNGPDVKVRGNAAHIAEKYLQLARDAQSSGDSVMAENYLQHAEHYFRIVSSAQQALTGQRDGQSQEDDFDDDVSELNSRFSSPQPVQQQTQNEAEEDAPAPAPAPRPSAREIAEAAPAAAEEAASGEEAAPAEAAGDGEAAPRKPRERRPRRRRPAAGEAGADPASAPQPDVGELPAFLTAGTTSAAE
jgi:chemotaxis protein histidine kinase CheA